MTHVRSLMLASAALVWLVLNPLAATAQPAESVAPAKASKRAPEVEERWYTLEMSGQRCGWMRAKTTTAETITSESEFKLAIKRGPIDLTIEMASTFVETPDGKPVYARNKQKLGQMPVDQLFAFTPGGILVTSLQGQTQSVSLKASPSGEWLPPAAAERYVETQRKAGAKKTTFKTMDPMTGIGLVTVTRTEEGEETITVGGKNVKVSRASVVMSAAAGTKTLEYTDEQGEMVKTETTIGTFNVVMLRTTREDAINLSPSGPELMVSTFVKPSGKMIRDERRTKLARYVLSVKDGELPAIPNTGSQSVEPSGPRAAKVSVSVAVPNAAPAAELEAGKFTGRSTMMDTQDAEVQKLRERALKNAPKGQRERSELLRRFVHKHISKKGLGVGFGSAGEVARSREGDCTEHGVLLATLLRADGIPARVACGLLYVDEFDGAKNVFGYHMWAQALLEVDGQQRWVDLDGTFPDDSSFDATHITLATSAMDDGDEIASLQGVAAALGRLEITIEHVE